MFVRSLYITTDPADVGPALDVIAKSVPGMMAEQPGFDGIGVFADRTLGKILTGSWWETEQALKDSDENLRDRRTEMLARFVSTITTMNLEAAAFTRPAAATSGGFRLQRMAFAPDHADRLVQAFKEVGLPRLQELDGFQGASLLLERNLGMAGVSVIFQDMDALAASRGPQAAIRKAAFEQMKEGVQLIALEEFEVVELDLPTSNPIKRPGY
jgi:heme-degrading monooxygenase HmoA